MRILLSSLLALSGCSACVTKVTDLSLPGIPAELDPSIALQGPNGSGGHACPVNGYVITAAHVTYDPHLKGHVNMAWSDGNGGEGFAQPAGNHPALDIVMLVMVGSPVRFLPAGKAQVGDTVYWYEYDFRTRKNALRARRRFASVLRVVAGHYILDGMPVGGASGTCLINNAGEAVGIVVAGWETQDGEGVGSAAKLPEELYAATR